MHTSESTAGVSLEPPTARSIQPPEKSSRNQLAGTQGLRKLAARFPEVAELQQLQALVEHTDWLNYFQRCSRLLVAVIEPTTLVLKYANDYFCRLVGVGGDRPSTENPGFLGEDLGNVLNHLLTEADNAAVKRLYRRHLLHLVLRDVYQVEPQDCRLLDEPVMLTLPSPACAGPRHVECWFRSEQLTITRLNPELDEFADLGLPQMGVEQLERQLADPNQVRRLEQRLNLENYQVEGWLLLEGVDVTDREMMHRITQLLINQDSILQAEKFREVDGQLRSLFRARNSVILCIEGNQTRLFTGSVSEELDHSTYSLDALQNSHFLQAVQTNQVLAVPDLAQDCHSEPGQKLLALGVRSLLLIPLVPQMPGRGAEGDGQAGERGGWRDRENPQSKISEPKSKISNSSYPVVGVVALLSDRPHNFDALDCRHAEQLIPAFTAALTDAQRQLMQRRFITNIHPAVEWRFLQEAERRSLGLPPEPIVFTDVYPLYGISDIRGSSDERNRAIQADLLEQFRLGLAVVDAACAAQEVALGQQLRLDLLEQIQRLQESVTVDAEVSGIRYLRDNLESYFDYFSGCGEAAVAAIDAYRSACNNEHQCVYQARTSYDEMIGKINSLLRETWERCQVKMQQITPHYCDLESTDGIDHMIYAGKSIDPQFSTFQLRSLRYEQLRAVCECARAAMGLQERYNTSMQVTHLVLVQDLTVDIFHDETTERLFDVRGTRDTRYEIVKKRIDKAIDEETQTRITQPGMLTLVYSTEEEWNEYQQYLRYLMREGWVDRSVERGSVQPLQGVNGLKYVRVRVLPATG